VTEISRDYDRQTTTDNNTTGQVPDLGRVSREWAPPVSAASKSSLGRVSMRPPADRTGQKTESKPHASKGQKAAALGAATVLALAACTTSAEPSEVSAMPDEIRFSHDYTNGYPEGEAEVNGHDIRASGQDCGLKDGPYDPFHMSKTKYYETPGSVLTLPDGTIQVTVTNGDDTKPVLHFDSPEKSIDDKGYPKPLTPLDDVTRQVIADAGCETEYYPRYMKD
jgi:hypothetical protein